MSLLILHPDLELKISNLQKELFTSLSTAKIFTFSPKPRWIFLDEEVALADAKKIKDIVLESPKIEQTDRCTSTSNDHSEVFCPAVVELENGRIPGRLPLFTLLSEDTRLENQVPLPDSIKNLFPMQIKIARLCKEVRLSDNSLEIEDFKWIKIR